MTATSVGISGLGRMGLAFAKRLRDHGIDVAGFDVAPGRVVALTQLGGRATRSNRELAETADVVLTSLPSADALWTVLEGDDALLDGAHTELVIVEMSTLAPQDKTAARKRAAAHDVVLLDCPVSGGPPAARAGRVALFTSGDVDAVERCTPLFDVIAQRHHYVGDVGMGATMKLLTNLLVAVHNVSTAEVLTLAEKAGMDPEQVCEILQTTSGDSKMLGRRGPMMAAHTYASADGIAMTVFDKDLRLIESFARSLQCPVPLFSTTRSLYAQALDANLGDLDSAAVHLLLRERAGIEPTE